MAGFFLVVVAAMRVAEKSRIDRLETEVAEVRRLELGRGERGGNLSGAGFFFKLGSAVELIHECYTKRATGLIALSVSSHDFARWFVFFNGVVLHLSKPKREALWVGQ